MPLKQTSKGCPRGPAPVTEEDEDIVDQTINLFKVQRISSLLVQHVGVAAVAAERHLLPSHMLSSGKYSLHLIRHGDRRGPRPGLPHFLHCRVSQEAAEGAKSGARDSGHAQPRQG